MGSTKSTKKVKSLSPWERFQRLVPADSVPSGWICDEEGVRNEAKEKFVSTAPLGVVAQSALASGRGHQLELAFLTTTGALQRLTVHREALASPTDIVRNLLDHGARVDPGNGRDLVAYLNAFVPKQSRLRVTQPGWVGDPFESPCFAYGSKQYGKAGNGKRLSFAPVPGTRVHEALTTSGTLEEWKTRVAEPLRGLHVPMFALCAAFTAPLLRLVGEESMGWHLFAETSRGKTTLLQVIASVYGRGAASSGAQASLVQSWNATDNAVELMAQGSNDLPLLLDELKAGDDDSLGKVIYMLSQGTGKQRMKRALRSADAYHWRVASFSTGEMSVREAIEASRKQSHGGQEVRLVGIPLEDDDYGENAGERVDALKVAARECFGTAGRDFVESLVQNVGATFPFPSQEVFRSSLDCHVEELEKRNPVIRPEQRRVTRQFALVVLAGDWATQVDILPYSEEEVFDAVSAIHARWLADSKTLTATDRALRHIQETLASQIRRIPLATDTNRPMPTRSGVYCWRTRKCPGHPGETYFALLPKQFQALCLAERAAAVSVARRLHGMDLMPRSNETSPKFQIHWNAPGCKRARYYFVSAQLLEIDLEQQA